jgi:outer membrane biosynthesis protein TonB
MRRARGLAAALLALASASVAGQEITGAGDELPRRAAEAIVIVEPAFPKTALARGASVSVDVVGRVRLDGTIGNADIRATPDDPEVRKAVEEVIGAWLFWPEIDAATCEAREVEAQVRIYFEVAGGQPRVSFSFPREKLRPRTPWDANRMFEQEGIRPVHKVMPKYPREAIIRKIEKARVIALLRVESDGSVSKVTAAPTYAHGSFLQQAARALIKWDFEVNPKRVKPGESVCTSAVLDFILVD